MSDTKTISIKKVRADFPILSREVHNKPLVYLDNGASSQKPSAVIDAISHYYEQEHSNIHRGVHFLSSEATIKYEEARVKIKNFINAREAEEIIFTKGTTDAINLVASSLGSTFEQDDEVLISTMEHHSNIVPWQFLEQTTLKVIPITDKGEFSLDDVAAQITDKTKLIAVTHVSNTLGTINPVKEIIELAHSKGIKVLIDGAQAVPHLSVDVQALDCDFYVFSGHKMYGPTGVGILYGKREMLDAMKPYQGGGDMISKVTFEKTTYNELPHKFEAGTPNIVGGIALGVAVDYLNEIGLDNIAAYEDELLAYATEKIKEIEGVRIIGEAENKAGVLSFLLDGTHPYDVGTLLDQLGIAVRTGHHCTEPLMNRFGIPGTIRASFSFYNTFEEIDAFIAGLLRAKKMLL